MATESGRFIGYGLGKETTRGTAVAPTYWVPQLTADFQNTEKFIYNESVFGVLNKNSGAEIVEQTAEGKIDGIVTDRTFGLLLLAAFGSAATVATADASNSVYKTTYTQSQTNTPTSLTITRQDNISDKEYTRAMLKSLEITVVVGEYVKYSSEWVSTPGVTASTTKGYTLENSFKASEATAKMATTTSGLTSATAIPMKSFKLTITRKVNPYFTFGQITPSDIYVEEFDTKGEFVLVYSDATYETPHFNNTLQAISLDILNTNATIGTNSNPELTFVLPKVTLNEWKVDQNASNVTEQTVGFTGMFDFASSSELQASSVSTVASY